MCTIQIQQILWINSNQSINATTDDCHLSRTPAVFLGPCVLGPHVAHDLLYLTQRRVELVRLGYRIEVMWGQVIWLVRAICNTAPEVIEGKHSLNESEMCVIWIVYVCVVLRPFFMVFEKTMSCGLWMIFFCVCKSQIIVCITVLSIASFTWI